MHNLTILADGKQLYGTFLTDEMIGAALHLKYNGKSLTLGGGIGPSSTPNIVFDHVIDLTPGVEVTFKLTELPLIKNN